MTLTIPIKNDILLISAEDTDFLLSKQPLSMCEETTVSSAEHRTGAFLLEEIMIIRKCRDCGKDKPLKDLVKSKPSLYGRENWCKECRSKYEFKNRDKISEKKKKLYGNISYRRRVILRRAQERCRSKKCYVEKGIKCFLTIEDVSNLWNRDKAYLLKAPSIDRKDPLGNYEMSNCRFIEMAENNSRAHKGKKLTDKHRENISNALKMYWRNL